MSRSLLTLLIGLSLSASLPLAHAQETREEARAKMIETIREHATRTPWAVGEEGIDPAVLKAMGEIPRHAFVPEDLEQYAYQDRPVPIGYGQTISQPFIVALMTDLLKLEAGDKALEIGTGSGYQAAVLSVLLDRVYTIEIIPALGHRASKVLKELGFTDVETKVGDGYYGWPEEAPFDAIVVTAAANHVPPPLIEQLAVGGRMVIPIGGAFSSQQLMLVEKQKDGSVTTRQLLPVRFVPLTRAE